MVRINYLKARMLECGISMERLSEQVGIHVSTMYRKTRQPDTFLLWELLKIKEVLGLSMEQFCYIFLDGESCYR